MHVRKINKKEELGNDYLYSGDTILKILQRYHNDLKEDAKKTQNGVDMIHCNFLLQPTGWPESRICCGFTKRRSADAIRCLCEYMVGGIG